MKDAFWHDAHTLLEDIPKDEFVFVGGYLIEHGGKGLGARNEPRQEILVLCKSYGLIMLNRMFIKQRRHVAW